MEKWIENSIEVVAPTLIMFEASSVLRNIVFRGILDDVDATEMIDRIRHLDLSLIYAQELIELAWSIGAILKAPTLYDCFYLAVAKLFKVPFWTSDKKLYKSAKKEFSFVNPVRKGRVLTPPCLLAGRNKELMLSNGVNLI